MSRRSRARGVWRPAAGALALLVVATVAGPATATAAASAGSGGTATVTVGDNSFKPDRIEVPAGTKVVWTNRGSVLHNVRPVKGDFGTKALPKGKRYAYRFRKPGEYRYYCSFHGSPTGGQRGVVIVTAATSTTTTPSSATP